MRLGDIATVQRGVRVVRSQLGNEGAYPVYQNSMVPLGCFDKYNCPENTVFIIAAGAAGEVGYSKVKFWAADDCYYLTCSENMNRRLLYYALLCQQDAIHAKVRRASIPRISRADIEHWTVKSSLTKRA